MLVPNYIPPTANPWFLLVNSTGNNYPSGLRNDDIVVLLEVDNDTFNLAPGMTTITHKESTRTVGSGTEQDPYVTYYEGRARVSWATETASRSGTAIGGTAAHRRLLVFRRSFDGGVSSYTMTPSQATGSSLDYTHDYFNLGYQAPVLPLISACQAGPGYGPFDLTGTIDGMTTTKMQRTVSRAYAGVFIPTSPELLTYPKSIRYQGTSNQIVTWKVHLLRKTQ